MASRNVSLDLLRVCASPVSMTACVDQPMNRGPLVKSPRMRIGGF